MKNPLEREGFSIALSLASDRACNFISSML